MPQSPDPSLWSVLQRELSFRFPHQEQVRVLDLGCGLGEDMYMLLHLMGFGNFTGVDLLPASYANDLQSGEPERIFFEKTGQSAPAHKYQFTAGVKNIYELYARIAEKDAGALPLTKAQFEKTFSFHWETDAGEYLHRVVSADIILISGLLHWLSPVFAYTLVRSAISKLPPGGWLCIKVNAPLNGVTAEGGFHYVNEAQLQEWMNGLEIVRMEMVAKGKLVCLGRAGE